MKLVSTDKSQNSRALVLCRNNSVLLFVCYTRIYNQAKVITMTKLMICENIHILFIQTIELRKNSRCSSYGFL